MPVQMQPSKSIKKLSASVLIAILGMAAGSSQAVNFGKTAIQSVQHEPLSASIIVNNVDAKSVNVSIANNAVYRQMGLKPNAAIKARFVKLSATSGKIVLTSNKPISDPFTDLVVVVEDKNSKKMLPKTLLMPLTESADVAFNKSPKPQATVKPNLPRVQAPTTQRPKVTAKNTDSTINNERQEITSSVINTQTLKQSNQQAKVPVVPTRALPPPVGQEPPIGALASDRFVTDGQTVASNKKPKSKPASAKVEPSTKAKNGKIKQTTAKNQKNNHTAKAQKPNKQSKQKTATASKTTKMGKSTYVVQRHDNLWTIANEIASRNNVDVRTVMQQIHQNNKRAFIKGDANRIIANSRIRLPDYQTVPSQKSLQKAIAAKRSGQSLAANNRKSGSSNKGASSKSSNMTAKSTNNKPTSTKVSNSRLKNSTTKSSANMTASRKNDAKVTLVTPSNGKNSGKGSGLSANSQLVKRLKNARQKTATTVARVNALNTEVSSFKQKIKIQDEKLAALQARLKELRKKK